jgi:phosphoribosyl-ATP pyrophosphohydrolase
MAELRPLDEKLAEVLGLAQAAERVASKVAQIADDEQRRLLDKMGEEAAETAKRCEAALDDDAFDGRKTAIVDKARETKQEATEMADTYLGEDADDLDGFEFLTMAEAGELGHWEILRTLNDKAGVAIVRELTDFAVPLQERHFETVRATSLELAAEEDPLEVE